MALDLLKPELFARDASGRVWLKGGRCSACDFVFFPMQTRGCERCGAFGTMLIEADLGGAGTLLAAATVHLHAGKSRDAPFVIGVVDLYAGPRVRTLLQDMPDAESRAGSSVAAMLIETLDREGARVLDLRFHPV